MRILSALALCFYGLVCAADASTVTFDFDTGSPALATGQDLPLDQTVGGLTAHFSSNPAFGGYSVQSAGTTFFVLSQFSGNYLYPNSLSPGPLDIKFSLPVSNITFTFATADTHQVEIPTTIQVLAFLGSTMNPPVGSVTAHGAYGSDTFPMGTLAFGSVSPFDIAEIGIAPGQPLGTGDLLLDNISVTFQGSTAVPEPMSLTLAGAGFAMLLAGRRLKKNGAGCDS